MRILLVNNILSRFERELTADFADGHTWIIGNQWSDEEICAVMPTIDVFVGARLTQDMATSADNLKLVHAPGAGYDEIAMEYLSERVIVANTFHHERSIAEHVIMVSIMLCRGVLSSHEDMRAGRWHSVDNDATKEFGETLGGRTLGIVGLGRIGVEVARLASAFGCRVQAIRGNPAASIPPDVQVERVGGSGDIRDLLSTSDIVVLTVPLNAATRNLIGEDELSAMRRTGILINVSRGGVVDEEALYAALATKQIAGAGIDVWWSSPPLTGTPPSRLPFHELDNIVLTPHQSGQTEETFAARAREIASNIRALCSGTSISNVVRPK